MMTLTKSSKKFKIFGITLFGESEEVEKARCLRERHVHIRQGIHEMLTTLNGEQHWFLTTDPNCKEGLRHD